MKKGLVVLAVLVMAAPLYAGTITFTATDNGPMGPPATCTITWTSDVAIVALGLDIDADDPINIDSIDSFFDIFMDLAYDEEQSGDYVYGEGSGTANNAAANQEAAGQLTMPAAAFAISAGGLGGASGPLTPPPFSGTIVLSAGVDTTGTIGANALRGGVIDEDGAQVALAGDSTWIITVDPPEPENCMVTLGVDDSHPAVYAAFLAAETAFGEGAVDCWCDQYNCAGDADRASLGAAKKWVTSEDLIIFSDNWLKKQTLLTHIPCPGYE